MTTIEDLAILQDIDNVGEDWQAVKRQRYPAKTFTFKTTTLTVLLANKLALEQQLGVDLIYVNETMRSVVFVQYKMFSGEDGEEGYRPDNQLKIEIERMDNAGKTLSTVAEDESCGGYRIGSDPFFFKFCTKLLTHDDQGHVPGIYVPLGFWKRLIMTPEATGPRGGSIVYAGTFGRRFLTPSHFTDLVGRGWIGTSTLQTDVLVPYLQAAVLGKKTVVLAVETKAPMVDGDADDEEEGHSDVSAGATRARAAKGRKVKYPGKKGKKIKI